MSSRQAGNHLRTAVLRSTLLLAIFAAVFVFRASCVFAEDQVPILTVKVDGTVVKEYFNVEEITAIPDVLTGPLTYSGYNSYPTWKTLSVDEAFKVGCIIKDATGNDVMNFGGDRQIVFSADNYSAAFTIEQLFGKERYYFPYGNEGTDSKGGKAQDKAYRNAVPVPVALSPAPANDTRLVYGQIAPNEQSWSEFVSGMLEGGQIEIISTLAAQKCESVSSATPADGSVVKDGTAIKLPIPTVFKERRSKTYYIVDPKDGEVPGEGSAFYFYSPNQWSNTPANNEAFTNPPIISGVGTHTLAVKVCAYGKLDSDVTYFKYTVKAESQTTPESTVTPTTETKPSAVKRPDRPVVTLKPGKKLIKLSWKKIKGAKGYVIYRSAKKSSGYKAIKTIKKGSTIKFTNKKLKKGKRYYYKIRAYKMVNGKRVFGKYSKVKSAKAK